ncbi:MAG: hypothetical protein EXS05_11885 [Planctomycetaceae bacterium]|nr:hypothetical protein [Planctomycetaceae bacterium]
MKQTLIVIAGALLGAVLGYHAFFWIAFQGYYALALPGGLLGLGAGFGRNRSLAVAVGCGLAALALGLFTEWRFAPFQADESCGFFLRNLTDLKPITLLMIVLGAGIGFWIPFRRIEQPDRANGENTIA